MENNHSIKKAEKTNKKRIYIKNTKLLSMPVLRRKIFLILGIILFIVGAVLSFAMSRPYEDIQKIPLISYKINSETSYKVFMLPNDIFPKKFIEEGQLYSQKLTDYVEIELKSNIFSDKKTTISGNYNIYALLEGYQTRSKEKFLIYEHKYPILSEEIQEETTNKANILKRIKVKPSTYKKDADNLEQILGGDVSRDLSIIFEGKVFIDKEEKDILQKISIPIDSSSFYAIEKTEPVNDEGSITKNKIIKVSPQLNTYFHFILLSILGLALTLFIIFFTKISNEEEVYKAKLSKILRKYGSRMICLEEIPKDNNSKILKLNDIESMISLSDELRNPVVYCMDENGFPDGKFIILGNEYTYVLELKNTTTTLVVDYDNFSE